MKRGANGRGTIIHRKEGRWEGKYTIGYTADGKQLRKSVYGKTQAECRKKLDRAIVDFDEGIKPNKPANYTLQEWIVIYINSYKKNSIKPSTVDKYNQDSRLYLYPTIGNTRLKDLTTDQIQTTYNELLKFLAPKTVRNVHGVLHEALEKAKRLGYIHTNPSEECEIPKQKNQEMNVITKECEIQALVNELQGNMYKNAILFALLTGLRLGELLGLTWDRVDFDNNTIVVDKQLIRTSHGKGGYYVLGNTKTDNTRMLIIPPLATSLLKAEKEKQDYWHALMEEDWGNTMNLVFTKEFGGHYYPCTVYRNFKKAAQAIGRGELRFHDLRHSYATICLANGDNVKLIQSKLGHKDIRTTLNRYSHITEEIQKQSADKLEVYFREIMEDTNSRQESRHEKAKPPETQ